MKIYISISCLDVDDELIKTIRSAFDNADNSDNINIGIAFIGNEPFYNHVLQKTKEYKNIKHKFYELENNLGVGKGRHLASLMYDNEDYFLQVDAHTFFMKSWDSILIKKFKKAKSKTKNNKVVLTGLPAMYGYYDSFGNKNFWAHDFPLYPRYEKDKFRITKEQFNFSFNLNEKDYDYAIPKTGDESPKNLSKKKNFLQYAKLAINGISPCYRVSAAFIFSDSNFLTNNILKEKYNFWEEEIMMSIDLISKDFSLVFVGPKIPLGHYYANNGMNAKEKFRTLITDLVPANTFFEKSLTNWIDFVTDKDNEEAINKYEGYSKISVLEGPMNEWYWPKKYYSPK